MIKNPAKDVPKTTSKRVIKKTSKPIGDLIGYKIQKKNIYLH